MKKEYVKPYLALESFQLVAALAGACSDKIAINQSVQVCTAVEEDPGNVFFGPKCGVNVFEGDASSDGICYNNMVDGGMYLTS